MSAQDPAEPALADAMAQLNVSFRALFKGVDENNEPAALEHVANMQAALLVAKLQRPHGVDEDELPGYRKLLVQVLSTTCDLETAILEHRTADANRLVKEELSKLKRLGHDTYQRD